MAENQEGRGREVKRWTVDADPRWQTPYGENLQVLDASGKTVCFVANAADREDNIRRAHLIAAAPDLHEALSWALDILDMMDVRAVDHGDPPALVYSAVHLAGKAKARSALALARGESQPTPTANRIMSSESGAPLGEMERGGQEDELGVLQVVATWDSDSRLSIDLRSGAVRVAAASLARFVLSLDKRVREVEAFMEGMEEENNGPRKTDDELWAGFVAWEKKNRPTPESVPSTSPDPGPEEERERLAKQYEAMAITVLEGPSPEETAQLNFLLHRAAAVLRHQTSVGEPEKGDAVEDTWWFRANREDVATIVGMLGRLTTRVAKLEATACGRCGHPQDWHRHDDTTEAEAFRCLGYDCDAPACGPERRCDCPDYQPPLHTENPLTPEREVGWCVCAQCTTPRSCRAMRDCDVFDGPLPPTPEQPPSEPDAPTGQQDAGERWDVVDKYDRRTVRAMPEYEADALVRRWDERYPMDAPHRIVLANRPTPTPARDPLPVSSGQRTYSADDVAEVVREGLRYRKVGTVMAVPVPKGTGCLTREGDLPQVLKMDGFIATDGRSVWPIAADFMGEHYIAAPLADIELLDSPAPTPAQPVSSGQDEEAVERVARAISNFWWEEPHRGGRRRVPPEVAGGMARALLKALGISSHPTPKLTREQMREKVVVMIRRACARWVEVPKWAGDEAEADRLIADLMGD